MRIKSLNQTHLLLIISILLAIFSVSSVVRDIFTERQRQQAKQRLEDNLKQGELLVKQDKQKTAEFTQVNTKLKECNVKLKQLGLEKFPEECNNTLTQAQTLIKDIETNKQKYEQLLEQIKQDYCLAYPDTENQDCKKP